MKKDVRWHSTFDVQIMDVVIVIRIIDQNMKIKNIKRKNTNEKKD